MMDFSLAESQQAVVGLAAQVLAEPKADAWKELAQAGLLALSVPARLGGDGLGVLEAAVLLTEIGRRALPVPALATLMTGVLPVVRWGSSALQRALLPAVAAGELILTAAIREPSDPEPDPPATAVTDGTVSGIKVGVPWAPRRPPASSWRPASPPAVLARPPAVLARPRALLAWPQAVLARPRAVLARPQALLARPRAPPASSSSTPPPTA